jgi:hypothetical protein
VSVVVVTLEFVDDDDITLELVDDGVTPLLVDDGVTPLLVDDGVTPLLVDDGVTLALIDDGDVPLVFVTVAMVVDGGVLLGVGTQL